MARKKRQLLLSDIEEMSDEDILSELKKRQRAWLTSLSENPRPNTNDPYTNAVFELIEMIRRANKDHLLPKQDGGSDQE